MLAQFQTTRLEALVLAESEFVQSIHPKLFVDFMQTLADIKLPVRLFVKNHGAVQIHSGAIDKIRQVHCGLTIVNNDFSLHFNLEAAKTLWIVERPGSADNIASLELYDTKGNNIALVYGEGPIWYDLLVSLSHAEPVLAFPL
jgi:putative hemin transport protein